MKKVFTLFAAAALLWGGACSDDNTPDEPLAEPSVTLTQGAVTDTEATFTILPTDAEQCAYLCMKTTAAASVVISAEQILEEGEPVAVGKARTITLHDLESEQDYTVYAAAINGSIYSEVAQLTFKTEATPEPAYETVIEATSALGEYFKSVYDDKTGNYMIKITDIVYDDYGYADSAGHAFTLDLYAPKTENAMNVRIPAGTYYFDESDSGAQFSVGNGYSKIEQTDEQGYPKGSARKISAAEVRIKTTAEGYDIAAYVTDKEGKTYKVAYRGDMVLANKTQAIGSDQQIDRLKLYYARYYGQADHNGIGNYYLSLGTVDVDEYNTALGNGWMIRLDFWGAVSADDDKAVLPDGTYRLTSTGGHQSGSLSPDATDVAYYFLTGKSPVRTEYGCSEGAVTVTRTGENYRLDGDIEMEDGSHVRFNYEGPLAFENRAEKLIGDIDAKMTKATCIYQGDQSKQGCDTYQLRLASDEQESIFVNIDLRTTVAASVLDPVIPDGTYTAAENDSRTPGTFIPGYLFSGYLAGTNIGKKDRGSITTYGLLSGGSIRFAYADGRYTITIDAVTTDNFSIKCTYEGELPLDNKIVGPAIGESDFTAGYAPFAYYYGKRTENSNDYYYYLLTFSDIEMKGSYNGIYPAKTEAGHSAVLYVYAGTKPAADGRVPEGTYALSDIKSGFTWDKSLSEGRSYDAQGNRSTVFFSSGTLTVAHAADDGYTIAFDAKTLREETFRFTYNGTIPMQGLSNLSKAAPSSSMLGSERPQHDAVAPRRDISAEKAAAIVRLPSTAPVARLCKEIASK